jgi:hypothetical protein
LHAACFTIGVAFLSAWMLAAPRCSFWALAGNAMAPNTSAAVANAMLSFLMRPSSLIAGLPEETDATYTISAALVRLFFA